MLSLGLIGRNISHSRSQFMYENILNKKIRYQLLDYEKDQDIPGLDTLFNGLDGLSITSPYKTHFLSFVQIDECVSTLGAINCIARKNGEYFATNTDYLAVKEIISKRYQTKEIIILGDGVMAKVTKLVLDELGKSYQAYSRKINGDLNKVDLLGPNRVVINCCSRDYLFSNKLDLDAIFWDYNYSYDKHDEFFKLSNIAYHDGLEMLRIQAEHALKFWGVSY